jgi:hypothetical protein
MKRLTWTAIGAAGLVAGATTIGGFAISATSVADRALHPVDLHDVVDLATGEARSRLQNGGVDLATGQPTPLVTIAASPSPSPIPDLADTTATPDTPDLADTTATPDTPETPDTP